MVVKWLVWFFCHFDIFLNRSSSRLYLACRMNEFSGRALTKKRVWEELESWVAKSWVVSCNLSCCFLVNKHQLDLKIPDFDKEMLNEVLKVFNFKIKKENKLTKNDIMLIMSKNKCKNYWKKAPCSMKSVSFSKIGLLKLENWSFKLWLMTQDFATQDSRLKIYWDSKKKCI